MMERLRTCCSLCGSPNITRVRSLRIYRCRACNQSFITPSMKLIKSYGTSLVLGAALRETERTN